MVLRAARVLQKNYERDIYPALQPDSKRKIVAIDIITGAWEIDGNEIIACRCLEKRYPDAQIGILRVGYKYVRKFGAPRNRNIA